MTQSGLIQSRSFSFSMHSSDCPPANGQLLQHDSGRLACTTSMADEKKGTMQQSKVDINE